MTAKDGGGARSETIGDLLAGYHHVNARLRDSRVLRSENQPTGDIAERIAKGMYGGEIAPQSTAGWDIRTPNGTTIQVKARRQLDRATHYSFISPGAEAHLYLFVLLSADFSSVVSAFEVEARHLSEVASVSGGAARPGSMRVTFRRLMAFQAKKDLTGKAQSAYEKILAWPADVSLDEMDSGS